MKNKSVFKEPLLISQEEMAMLLGITRSQWSMVALGQRGLTLVSKAKLEVLQANAAEILLAKPEKLVQVLQQENEREKAVINLLQDNTFNQLQVQKKLSQMEKQFQAALNTLYFVGSFENKAQNKSVLKVLENKAKKVLDKNALAHQEVLAIKLEVLKLEEMLLKQRMKKLY